MKITRHGIKFSGWPKVVSCERCNCEVEATPEDAKERRLSPHVPCELYVICPECGNWIYLP